MPHIQADRGVDVPETQSGNQSERNETARNQERRIEVGDFFGNVQRLVRPREDVILSDEDENQQQERDREECDISLEKADDRSRPAGRRNALHRDEHHTR